ncbi:MAG: SMC-Scp complex subunit ScpB [Treponema sp.]|jgi:segregation and condensation protein B|nr:SMC-Scp complex subunit ScpB [Treponema sp.]
MELHLEKETALIEAILFMETEPRDEAALARISELSGDVVAEALARLKEKYAEEESGLHLAQISGGWLLNPKPDFWDFLKDRYGKKNEGRLSRAAMETLAIIAWSQPVTRAEIEALRGVSADTMIRLLMDRELIREVGKKDVPGKPIQYGTTKEFLKFFRLNSIADLPKLDESEQERFELSR